MIRYWEDLGSNQWYAYMKVASGKFEYTSHNNVSTWKENPSVSNWSQVETNMRILGFVENQSSRVYSMTYPVGTIRRWELKNASGLDWIEYVERTPGSFETCDGTLSGISSIASGWLTSTHTGWMSIEALMALRSMTEVPVTSNANSSALTVTLPARQSHGITNTPIHRTAHYVPKIDDIVRVIGQMSYSARQLHGQIGRVVHVDPNGYFVNLDLEYRIVGGGKGLHPDEIELHNSVTYLGEIGNVPVNIEIKDHETRHKCHCDLTGANMWLGCRCGGV